MAEGSRIDTQHPWPWLDPFTEAASDFFHGRDADAQALLRSVLATPVCVLFGKSGLGKTSLLMAGLFPLLRARTLLPVPLRRFDFVEGGASLSAQLLRALTEAVAAARLHWTGPSAEDTPDGDDVAVIWERLHDRRQQLLDDQGRRWTPVFVLDQFEEMFTLQLDEGRRRQAFEQLGDLLENRLPPSVAARLDHHEDLIDRIDIDSQPYRFLISLREDFLPDLEAWADLIPRLGPNRYRLMPMSGQQAFEAVQTTGGTLVDADSARRIVEFLGRQAQAGSVRVAREDRRIEPPLLSLVCASLNADRLERQPPGLRLDVGDLETRGAQILDRFYDGAFTDLPEDVKVRAQQWVEANLITEGGARRPYPFAAVDATLVPALRHLIDRRLMRIENTEQGDQVELVHDRLAGVALQRAQATQHRAEEAERLRMDKEAAEMEVLKQRARIAEIAEERARVEQARADDALRASRRARRLTRAAMAGFVLTLTASAGAYWQTLQARAGRLDAHANQLAANALLEVERDPSLALVLARAAVTERRDNERAVSALRAALAAHVPNLPLALPEGVKVATSRTYVDASKSTFLDFSLSAFSVSPNGDLAIVPSANNAFIWSTVSGKPVGPVLTSHKGIVGAALFSPDGQLAVTTSADNTARVWNVSSGMAVATLEHTELVNGAAFSRDGSLLVTLGDDVAMVWKVGEYGKERCKLDGNGGQFVTASFSEDQRFIATLTHFDATTWRAQVWNVSDCRDLTESTVGRLVDVKQARWARFSDVGPHLGLVTVKGDVTILNAASPRWNVERKIVPAALYERDEDPDESLESWWEHSPPPLAWTRDGEYFAFAGGDNVVRIAAVRGDAPPIELRGHTGRITSITFDAEGGRLLTTSADRTARVWPLRREAQALTFGRRQPLVLRHREAVGSGVFSHTGNEIITAGEDGTIRLWTPLVTLLETELSSLRAASFSTDGRRILTAAPSKDNVRLVEFEVAESRLNTGKSTATATVDLGRLVFGGPTLFIEDASGVALLQDVNGSLRNLIRRSQPLSAPEYPVVLNISPHGRFVATTAMVWDVTTLKPGEQLVAPAECKEPSQKAISDDGKLAWYCVDSNLVVVDAPSQRQPRKAFTIPAPAPRVESVRFSASGRWLAVTLEDNSLLIFETDTGKPLSLRGGHTGPITSVDFSNDERFVVTVSEDASARVWDVTSGAQVAVLPAAGQPLLDAAFSPDGLSVLLRSRDRLQLWRCYQCGDTDTVLKEAQQPRRSDRQLRLEEKEVFDLRD